MTADSDGLAPVTYLFGAQASKTTKPSPSESTPPSSSDGWYTPPAEDAPPTGDRAQPRSDDRRSSPASPATPPTKSDLSHLPRFIENPVVDDVEPARPEPTKAERRASNVSLNALARRGMSTREMEKLLERRELEPELIESEISRLEGAGLLDDSALAENLVRTLQDRKGLGKSAIAAELRRRQVTDEAIAGALDEVDVDDELERATEIAIKRAGQLSSYDAETAKRRLGAFLQRRGYSGPVLSAAMKAALEGRASGSGPRFR